MRQTVIISENIAEALTTAIASCEHDKIFIIVDEHTDADCLPSLSSIPVLSQAEVITVKSGDTHKNLESLAAVWKCLSDRKATRHSLIINLGGGMVTDLGGFAASTFKRGLNFINIPTTLLAMVDASVGGKTGINFNGLKNEIGVFKNSDTVIIDTFFLKTLDRQNLCSGYAEMIKHGLISSNGTWQRLMVFDILNPDLAELKRMVSESIKVKEEIVEADPKEHGIRKALNFGHTFGHAFESFAMSSGRPILHGYAVAFGLITELYLSTVKSGFPTDKMRQTVRYIRENYGWYSFSCDDYPAILELMRHDKKNALGVINFTLLEDIGNVKLDQTATKEEIFEAFDFLREG